METWRTFVAIELPDEIKKEILKTIEGLKNFKVSWIRKDNLHLTLKFLGDTAVEKIEDIKQAVDAIALKQKPFKAVIQGLGGFPNKKRPRVLWLGMGEGAKEVCDLAAGLDAALEPMGFKKAKQAFQPHLTIGRIHFPKPNPLLESELKEDKGFGMWEVKGLTFFKSTLKPDGAVYEALHQSQFI